MARKTPVAADQAAVSTATAVKPTRTRAPRASRAKVLVVDTPAPVEPEPSYQESTEETVAATQAAITAITWPSMDALMVFGNTEDPDAANKRVVARTELVEMFARLHAKSAELATIYGPGSIELNIATTAVVQLHADLDDIDVFDLLIANPTISEAVAVLNHSTDVKAREEARQKLRDLRGTLREDHNQAVSIGLDRYKTKVGEAIEAIEAAMTQFSFGESDGEAEEAALRAADADNVPVVIECPYPVLEFEGAPRGQVGIILPEGESITGQYYKKLGRDPDTGCYMIKRLDTGDPNEFLFQITATRRVALLVQNLRTVKLPNGTIQVETDGINAYIGIRSDEEELELLGAVNATPLLLGKLKDRLGSEYVALNVSDVKNVLGHQGDIALVIEHRKSQREDPRVVCVPEEVYDALGESRAQPAPKLGETLSQSQQERLAAIGTDAPSTNRNPAPKPGRGRTADKPAPVSPEPEPTGSDTSQQDNQHDQDRQPPARPVQTTAPRSARSNTARSGSPVERRLVNKVVPKASGIRIVTVPGAPERHTTLIVEPGIEIDVFDYPNNIGIWTSVEGLGRGNGWRLTVMETVLVVIKAAARDSWLDNGRIVVKEVLFAREPLSRTFLRPATRAEMILSRRIMDMLVEDGKLYYEKPDTSDVHADIEQMRVRAEEDELLAWMLDTDDNSGEGIIRFAVTTVAQIEHAYRETGVRYTSIPLVGQSD